METVLLWLLAAVLVVLGIAGVVLPALPGPALVFLGLLVGAWIDDFARVGGGTVVGLGALAALAWLVDFVVSALGAKRVGASTFAIVGAALGTVAGLFFGVLGLLLGPLVGAVGGELLAGRASGQAARAGVATWIGMAVGVAVKLAIAFAMIGLFALAYFIE